jgi:hypothetical protein
MSAEPREPFADCDRPAADRDLPRGLWRQLMLATPVPVGGAALVIGTNPVATAERLCEFGLDVLALCDDPTAVMSGRLRSPSAEFQLFDSTATAQLPHRTYDLILVLDTAAWPTNLLGRPARLLTATVLAAVKPGQRVLWRHEPDVATAHQAGCWFRHLACFPGGIDVRSVSVPRWPLSVLRPVHRRETTVVEFTTPEEPFSAAGWRQCVDQGLLTDRGSCCAASSLGPLQQQSRAA